MQNQILPLAWTGTSLAQRCRLQSRRLPGAQSGGFQSGSGDHRSPGVSLCTPADALPRSRGEQNQSICNGGHTPTTLIAPY